MNNLNESIINLIKFEILELSNQDKDYLKNKL